MSLSASLKGIIVGLALLSLALLWMLFGPVKLSGNAVYVVTSGISMEPNFHTGDLAILRPAPSYHVGEIVAYRSPQISRVLHRIHAEEGGRFVMKGDNNNFIDPYHPAPSDVVGRLWIHVPKVGAWFAKLQQPRNAALLAASGGLLFALPVDQRRRRRRLRGGAASAGNAPTPPGSGSAGVLGIGGQAGFTALVILAVASLLLALFAFSRPTEVRIPSSLSYKQAGSFSYSAPASGDVYDGQAATTGQPIFRKLADKVDVSFDYTLSAALPANVSGSGRLDAVLGRADGWTRTIPLASATSFSGEQTSLSGTLDLKQVQALIDTLNQQAGISPQSGDSYSLSLVPAVQVQGTLGGAKLDSSFAPTLSFRLDALELQLDSSQAGQSQTDPLKPSAGGNVTVTRLVANRLPLLFVKPRVAMARTLAEIGLLVSLLGGLLFGLLTWRASQAEEPARIKARYAPLLVSLRGSDLGATGRVVEVASIDDLARVAEREGRMILHEQRGASHDYFVQDVDVTYRYRAQERDGGQSTQPALEAAP